MVTTTVPIHALQPIPEWLDDGVVITINSNKGGVGKTTAILLLAYYLASLGYELVLVDWDPQCNLSTCLGFHMDGPDKGLYSADDIMAKTREGFAAETLEPIRWVLKTAEGKLVKDHQGNPVPDPINERIQLVPGHADLADRYMEIVHPDARFRLDAALGGGVKKGKIVLVDTGPGLGPLNETAWAASDAVLGIAPLYYNEIAGVIKTRNKILSHRNALLRPNLDVVGMIVNEYVEDRTTQRGNLGPVIDTLDADRVWTDTAVPEVEQIARVVDQHKSFSRLQGTSDKNKINKAGLGLARKIVKVVSHAA